VDLKLEERLIKRAQPILSILLPAPSILFSKKKEKKEKSPSNRVLFLFIRVSFPRPDSALPSCRARLCPSPSQLDSALLRRRLTLSLPSFSTAASLLPSVARACARPRPPPHASARACHRRSHPPPARACSYPTGAADELAPPRGLPTPLGQVDTL
jgi:hypothetical protein